MLDYLSKEMEVSTILSCESFNILAIYRDVPLPAAENDGKNRGKLQRGTQEPILAQEFLKNFRY